jgi:DNA invertase Pin-like site-specific DNA recombinase
MIAETKILTEHRNRRACVYLRQSTMAQLVTHAESTARQYALRDRALALGWPNERVEVIDEDLGRSGQSTDGRDGFQRLADDVAHGRVGAIFALEVSRLARSSADWHRLLELCSLADVVIADEHTVYRPSADYNDRLLLGFKGQMSEAESHWMRLRLHGAKMSKARRGELRFKLPVGLVWVGDKIELNPDESVRKAISMVFQRFRITGTAGGVMRYFSENGVRFPQLDPKYVLRWDNPTWKLIHGILKNPLYAGAYAYGRRPRRKILVDGEIRRDRTTMLPVDRWPICLPDSHPGYITWDEFLKNQERLRGNMTSRQYPEQRGAPRNGQGLLQGLVLCGRCGQRMRPKYLGRTNIAYYFCERGRLEAGSACWTVAARAIDEAVERVFLETMQSSELDLSLEVVRQVEAQSRDVDRQWQMQLERARYVARQAERRYQSVDPENRLVARTLETAWESSLRDLAELEREYEEARRRQRIELTDRDRKAILALAKDLPKVWRAPTTSIADRKNLLRIVLRDVVLRPIDVPARMTGIEIVWQTGFTTSAQIPRPGRGRHIKTDPRALDRIRELVSRKDSDTAIAAQLNAEGFVSGTGGRWTRLRVSLLRHTHGIRKLPPRERLPARREDGAYSLRGLAARLGVSDRIIYAWVRTGRVPAERIANALWFKLDDEALGQLARGRR